MAKTRRRKSDSQKAIDLFAKAAANLGLDKSIELDSVKEEYKKKSHDAGDSQPLARKISGEAILWRIENLDHRGEFITRKCRRESCGLAYQTNYKADGYCSYECTEKDLKEKYGIEYDTSRPIEDRWGWRRERWEIPLKIPPSGLVALEEFATKFLADLAEFRKRQEVLAKNPRAATRYLWSDRGLSEELLDEYYPLAEDSPEEEEDQVGSLPEENPQTSLPNPVPQTQEKKDQSSDLDVDLFGDLLD